MGESPPAESTQSALPAPHRIGDFSPDGDFYWNGQGWIPAPPTKIEATVSAGTAFKIGFFGFFGVLVAAIIPWLFVAIFAGFLLSAFRH